MSFDFIPPVALTVCVCVCGGGGGLYAGITLSLCVAGFVWKIYSELFNLS